MKPCCEDLENRAEGAGPRGAPPAPDGITVTHCIVCKCRHFEVDAELGAIGVAGTGL